MSSTTKEVIHYHLSPQRLEMSAPDAGSIFKNLSREATVYRSRWRHASTRLQAGVNHYLSLMDATLDGDRIQSITLWSRTLMWKDHVFFAILATRLNTSPSEWIVETAIVFSSAFFSSERGMSNRPKRLLSSSTSCRS